MDGMHPKLYPFSKGRTRWDRLYIIYCPLVIQRGVGVGHAPNGGEAAPGRRPGAGGNSLLFLEAGLPQVAVEVDKSRADG